jgi:hypothetical protein
MNFVVTLTANYRDVFKQLLAKASIRQMMYMQLVASIQTVLATILPEPL